MEIIFSYNARPDAGRGVMSGLRQGRGLGRAGLLLICLCIAACASTPPPRPFAAANPPLEFIDYMPLEPGVLQLISLHFGYEVTPAEPRPFLVIYRLDRDKERKEALATVEIDGIVVNEYSRKSVFAVSWDESTLLYMHEQLGMGPVDLRTKPAGLYQYSAAGGERLIYPGAGIIAHSTFQLTRNSIEFALGDPNDPATEHYLRTTEGVEFVQEEAFILQFGGNELHRAAEKGNLARIRRLVATGLNLETTDNRGFTPLHAAIWEKQERAARLLIESGADIHAPMLGTLFMKPLEEAARFGLVDTIELLLERGAEIDSTTREGATPLHLAVEYERFPAAVLLIQRGANVNAVTLDGNTPLLLFANGDRDERNAADWRDSSAESVLTLLLAEGAAIDVSDAEGATPLHYAVLKNNLRTARVLIENGADAQAMELAQPHYYGKELHHEESEMTLQQRMRETLDSPWWQRGMAARDHRS